VLNLLYALVECGPSELATRTASRDGLLIPKVSTIGGGPVTTYIEVSAMVSYAFCRCVAGTRVYMAIFFLFPSIMEYFDGWGSIVMTRRSRRARRTDRFSHQEGFGSVSTGSTSSTHKSRSQSEHDSSALLLMALYKETTSELTPQQSACLQAPCRSYAEELLCINLSFARKLWA
jgi:hypothetical protein